MKFALGLPLEMLDHPAEFASPGSITEMARHAEALGFDAVFVTDHPAGDEKWLTTGGHHAWDPFVALSFAAAATTTLRVMTHILVLPYRNPFLTAKSLLSLDALSNGRVTLGVAAGYLRSEFNSLGVNYDERNELTSESIEVIRGVLQHDAFEFEGRHFRSRGTTMRPRPTQRPHPPIWMGGNSKAAIRRAVEQCQGWCPFPNPQSTARATRTPALETIDDFARRVEIANELAGELGRTDPLDICFAPLSMSTLMRGNGAAVDGAGVRDELAAYESLGVTWCPVGVHTTTRAAWLVGVERLATRLGIRSAR